MARKQAKRRKPKSQRRITMPTVRWSSIAAPLLAGVIVFGTYQISLKMLDREISSIEISGPLQRVSALQIEEAISGETAVGFVAADLQHMRQRVMALPWIDQARVARRWPSRIAITVTEQVPAAVWGDSGLLNTRGELFVTESRHLPPELPRLKGPDDRSAEVAALYLEVRDRLIPVGLDVREVRLDDRGSWRMTLNNGVEVRLGRRSVGQRTELFLDVVSDIVAGRAKEIEYVDMRYGNGFSIGWNPGSDAPGVERARVGQEMLAARGSD